MDELINKNTHLIKEEIETLPNIQQSIDVLINIIIII